MGLLRLINGSRLAPLEELLAEVRSGAPASGTGAGAARAASAASIPALPRRETTSAAPVPLAATPRNSAVPPGSAQAGIAAPQASGLSIEQVAQIKEAIQGQQKFLGELVEHGSRWELDGAELRIYFSPNNRAFAELLEGRESVEKVRVVSSKVLGRAVRVCAKLEAVAAAAASASCVGSATQGV